MRATLCALAFGVPFLLPTSLFAQWVRSEYLNRANTNPPPAPFREALYVERFPEPPAVLNNTSSEVRRLQLWANRMETGWRDASSRAFNKQNNLRNDLLAEKQARYPDRWEQWTPSHSEHVLRYYGNYIVPPRPSVLTPSYLEEQRHELRTRQGSQFPLRERP